MTPKLNKMRTKLRKIGILQIGLNEKERLTIQPENYITTKRLSKFRKKHEVAKLKLKAQSETSWPEMIASPKMRE